MSASAGKVLLTPKGDFSTSATYSILDWVRYNGGVYVAKQTTIGNLPTDTDYWEKMIDPVSTLSGLSDVNITNVADGETLIWDATNSEWVNGTITGGGSYITLTTTTEQGENVSMSIGGATYTGTFSSEGICRFEGVKETGTATVSTQNVTITFEINYYGNYVIDVNPYYPTYGVEWDGTATTLWTRTDESADFVDPVPYIAGATNYSSPFDDIMPWSGMVKEERAGGTMVKIPKFWYKITQNGAGIKVQIATGPRSGFKVSPAHMDRGDGRGERDYIYVGRYHCGATAYKSVSGETPRNGEGFATYLTNIHSIGSNIWMLDFATRFTIWLLYIVEYANWNSQEVIGYGCGAYNAGARAMGYTDSMPYHTGTNLSNRTTYGLGTQYRNIEGLWDNVVDYVAGIHNISNNMHIILNPNDFSDLTSGVNVGALFNGQNQIASLPVGSFSLSQETGSFDMIIPAEVAPNNTGMNAYSADVWYWVSGYSYMEFGGSYNERNMHSGILCVKQAMDTFGISGGTRLMELP